MTEPQGLAATEECARSFMLRSQHSNDIQHFVVPGFLGTEDERIPAFRLPSKSRDCCDLCAELESLIARTIGPDLRFNTNVALFFPSREYLVLKISLPKEYPLTQGYLPSPWFVDRYFYVYAHPAVPCPWSLFKPYPFQKLDWAFRRLQKCATEHQSCDSRNYTTPLPTRVIRVGRRADDIRLQKGGFCAPYICLSHCWGSKQPLTTNKHNVDDHFGCIVWEDLPLLYQDTIRLAWRLDIEFVWIDSLCIIQNSPDDWAREAGRMQYVYGNSWLTVAATSNPDCCSGILDNPRDGEARAQFASFQDCIRWSGVTAKNEAFSWLAVPGDINTCEGDKHENGNCRWPLLTRGWVFQERLLSPRVLYFTAAGLLWTCKNGIIVESTLGTRYGRPTHLSTSIMGTRIMGTRIMGSTTGNRYGSYPYEDHHLWLRIIEEYSKLKLSSQDDRLSALSGLAQKASQVMPPGAKYLAGLWSSSLPQGLLWFDISQEHRNTTRNGSSGSLEGCPSLCQVHQGAPSWSWAAVNGAVGFPEMSATTSHTQICGTDCTPASHHDPTGRVTNGRIHLRGPISPLTKTDNTLIIDRGSKYLQHGQWFETDGEPPCENWFYFDCPMHMDFNYLIDHNIRCLLMYTRTNCKEKHIRGENWSIGLLLQPVGKDSEFRRVGLVKAWYSPEANYDPSALWFKRSSNLEDVIII